jgi:uroporphyrin-III C-methyltransferase
MTDTERASARPPVALIGAGPGDPDLLTLRAVQRLREADVVLYDDLASGAILSHARAGAELVAVGKRAGRASPKQSHVSRLIVTYARMGRRVVRLKSGDPGVFGRLDEETEALRAAGVAFEVIPGVSSASAAAAAAGLSLTRRGVARRVQFVTGHDEAGALPASLDLGALADPDATTCVFMGKATFPALAERLIARGLSPDTPALLAENVGLPQARTLRDSVAGLADRLAARPELGPCIILYGAALAAKHEEG